MAALTPAADALGLRDLYLVDGAGTPDLPISPFKLAEALEVPVFVSEKLPDSHSGYLDWDDEGPFIVINAKHSHTRQRFTCAHELGHYWDVIKNRRNRDHFDRDERAALGNNISEVYANRFAAALLMPSDLVKDRFCGGLEDAKTLARIFRVSEQAMKIRLSNLGLVKDVSV